MAVRTTDLLAGSLDALRWEPLTPRLRAWLDGVPVVDTDAARVVWEPGRVVPQYAVPQADLTAELVPPPTTRAPGTGRARCRSARAGRPCSPRAPGSGCTAPPAAW
jgi:uncharacterized protein (DUF427 family)